jgi:hypothetical protein
MRVGFIQSIIANKKVDYEIAVIWYDKTEAEEIVEDDISPAEWEEIVKRFSHSKSLNQLSDEVFKDCAEAVIEKRTAK